MLRHLHQQIGRTVLYARVFIQRFSHVLCFQSRCVPRIPSEEVTSDFMNTIQSAFAECAREIAATNVADDQTSLADMH